MLRRLGIVGVIPAVMALSSVAARTPAAAAVPRQDPVVMDGSALPKLIGTAPSHVVAFAWTGTAWRQIPVQVDQRQMVNPGKILDWPKSNWPKLPGGSSYRILVYTDPAVASPGYTWWPTFTGTAKDPGLGAVDEVSFLSSDAGAKAPKSAPPPDQVTTSTKEQVKVADPLSASVVGYVYLYASPTLTGGGAGTTGVDYTFNLDSGNYLSTYRMGPGAQGANSAPGPNPEQSTVVTPNYTQSYGDRWLNNALGITAGGAPGTDVLERGRIQLVPGYCGRSEDTFDDVVSSTPYEGAFIVNISGPVRAIRSYIGANSGTYTAETDVFYPQREDSIANLRVHTIPGVMSFDDFVTGTPGLTYSDSANPAGVPIDGAPDTLAGSGAPTWQMVSGGAGSLVTVRTLATDITGLGVSRYYLDQSPANPTPCTGDTSAWGQSGSQVVGPGGGNLPCTDPTIYGNPSACPTVAGQSTANTFTSTRYRYFEAPSLGPTGAGQLAADATNPLTTTVKG